MASIRELLRNRALVVCVVSLTLWTAWNTGRDQCSPTGDLNCGHYTDHYTHMGLARLFTKAGLDIYRYPRGVIAPPVTGAARDALPADVRGVEGLYTYPGWPEDRPITMTWTVIPSYYPPGDLLVFAPPALLYHFFPISFSMINRIMIGLLIIGAHVALYLALRGKLSPSDPQWLGVLGILFLYSEAIHWALQGFYDIVWAIPLMLTPMYFAKRNPAAALLTVSLAVFMHYRALFYVPWGLYGLYLLFKTKAWENFTRRQEIALGLGIVCGVFSMAVFRILSPALARVPVTNDISLRAHDVNEWGIAVIGLMAVAVGAIFVWSRAWLDLGMLAWVCFMLLWMPEVHYWDSVTLLPWLAARVDADMLKKLRPVREARTAFIILVVMIPFGGKLTPTWLGSAWSQFFG